MKTYKITKANFLEWYFNTGYDDDQEGLRTDLGQSVIEQLFAKGKATITVEDIFEECEPTIINLKFLEGFGEDENEEICDVEEEDFEVILID